MYESDFRPQAVPIERGLLPEKDRMAVIIERYESTILFRYLMQNEPFYYASIEEVLDESWQKRMSEKRWYTDEVNTAVHSLI